MDKYWKSLWFRALMLMLVTPPILTLVLLSVGAGTEAIYDGFEGRDVNEALEFGGLPLIALPIVVGLELIAMLPFWGAMEISNRRHRVPLPLKLLCVFLAIFAALFAVAFVFTVHVVRHLHLPDGPVAPIVVVAASYGMAAMMASAIFAFLIRRWRTYNESANWTKQMF